MWFAGLQWKSFAVARDSSLTLVLVTLRKQGRKASEDRTKHNVLDKAQPPRSFPDEATRHCSKKSSSEIISGANFPEVMLIVFFSMLFHSNRDEMGFIDLLRRKLGLTLSVHFIVPCLRCLWTTLHRSFFLLFNYHWLPEWHGTRRAALVISCQLF